MRSRFRPLVSLVLSAALLLGCVGCGGSAKAPTTITVWNYYSGDLLTARRHRQSSPHGGSPSGPLQRA